MNYLERSTGCWEFNGYCNKEGYGLIKVDGKVQLAHRYAYYLEHGYYPEKVRHTCDNPSCINPIHLLEGTDKDNSQDMISRGRHWNQKKTHCKHGHEFTKENTYLNPQGKRICRSCRTIHESSRVRVR